MVAPRSRSLRGASFGHMFGYVVSLSYLCSALNNNKKIVPLFKA